MAKSYSGAGSGRSCAGTVFFDFNPLRPVVATGSSLPLRARCLARLESLAQKVHPRRPVNPQHLLGRQGEELAYWFLRRQGYTIVARNYRFPRRRGELDLIGWEGGVLVFVEVKSRFRRDDYSALRAVDLDKRRQLIRLARAYRRRKGFVGRFRFDVVAVYQPHGSYPELELHRDAFWAE